MLSFKSAPDVLKQGAEAKLYIGEYNGTKCLVKERFKKNYRLDEIDKTLTRQRIKAETKAVKRCEDAGVRAPMVYHVDFIEKKIYMEYFDKAITAKEFIIQIEKQKEDSEAKLNELAKKIGEAVGKLHLKNITHGDLTTSNIMIETSGEDYELIVIDFGLSSYSTSAEDKGVDLYVLERALLSTHSSIPGLFESILKQYRITNTSSEDIIKKFEEVRARGRKRTMVG